MAKEDYCKMLVENHDNSYYSLSFLGFVMKTLHKDETAENVFLREIFYGFIKMFSHDDDLAGNIELLFDMSNNFNKLILGWKVEHRRQFCEEFYNEFIRIIIINYRNGDYDAAKVFFTLMLEKVKLQSGFYYFNNEERKALI